MAKVCAREPGLCQTYSKHRYLFVLGTGAPLPPDLLLQHADLPQEWSSARCVGLDSCPPINPPAARRGDVASVVGGLPRALLKHHCPNRLVHEYRPGPRQKRLGGYIPDCPAYQFLRLFIPRLVRPRPEKERSPAS